MNLWPESFLLFGLAFSPALFLAVVWHEFGHYLAARIVGRRVLAWGVGMARPWLKLPHGDAVFFVGRPLTGGITLLSPPVLRRQPGADFVIIAAGPTASFLGATIGLVAWWRGVHSDLLLAWIAASALLWVLTAIPFCTKRGHLILASDGWQLIDILRNHQGVRRQPLGALAANLTGVSELLRQIGALGGADYYRLLAGSLEVDLGNPSAARQSIEIGRQIRGDEFPEAPAMLEVVEVALLVGAEDAAAGPAACAARARWGNLPEAGFLFECLELQRKVQTGESVGEQLELMAAQASRESRPDHLCVIALLGFEASPPDDAAAACRNLMARYGHLMFDTQRARLLAVTTETLAKRQDYVTARAYFLEAQQAILRAAEAIATPEARAAYLQTASLPLQRAVLLCGDDVPLFLPDRPVTKAIAGGFGKASLNLGCICLGLAILAHWAQDLRTPPLSREAVAAVLMVVLFIWFASLLTTIVSLLRSERRYVQVFVGMILATAGLVFAGQLIS